MLQTTKIVRRTFVSPKLSPCTRRVVPHCPQIFAANSRWNASRAASTTAPQPEHSRRTRISVIFGALITVGVASTAYGIYEFYNTFTMWPPVVRQDLRAGIKARNQGNLDMSERYLKRALDTAHTLPLDQLSPEPHLKLSGIALVLGSVLESNNKLQGAYNTYVVAYERLQAATDRTGPEKARAGVIAYKLGQLSESQNMPREERRWYEAACKDLLDAVGSLGQRQPGDSQPVDLAELALPGWVSEVQLAEPLRALASCYTRSGDNQLALTALLVAVPLVLGPAPQDASSENLCIGADLMNTVAQTLLEGPPTPEARQQAEHAVSQAIELIEIRRKRADKEIQGEPNRCEQVMAVALFNWGILREMDGDYTKAKQLYQRSRKQSAELKEREGIMQAETALRRLDRLTSKADSKGAASS